MHAEAHVIGTDISPIQPPDVPPNLQFELEDCTSHWTFSPSSFDYIHMRFLVGSVDDWTALMERAFKACKPGGYIESFEPSVYIENDDHNDHEFTELIRDWNNLFQGSYTKLGRSFELYEQDTVRAALQEAGFIDVHETNLKTPIGAWKSGLELLGAYTRLALLSDLEGYLIRLADAHGWSLERIMVYASYLRRWFLRKTKSKVPVYYRQRIVWARKPGQ